MSIKLKRDEITATLAKELAREFAQWTHVMLQSCINCDNFKEDTEICSLFNQRPPARIIVESCEKWVELIPF